MPWLCGQTGLGGARAALLAQRMGARTWEIVARFGFHDANEWNSGENDAKLQSSWWAMVRFWWFFCCKTHWVTTVLSDWFVIQVDASVGQNGYNMNMNIMLTINFIVMVINGMLRTSMACSGSWMNGLPQGIPSIVCWRFGLRVSRGWSHRPESRTWRWEQSRDAAEPRDVHLVSWVFDAGASL